MKKLTKYSGALSVAVIATVLMLAPTLAYAQNPIIEGMKNNTAITIAKAVIMVVALLVLGGQTVPSLMKGEGGEVVKSALGVAILVGIAIKLKDIIDLFAMV